MQITQSRKLLIARTGLPLLFLALTISLTGCDPKPRIFHVEATQGFCDSGFDAWDKPVCSGEMKAAGVVDFTVDVATQKVSAELMEPNSFAKRTFLNSYENCKINDGLNWSCEVKDQYFIKVKQGHYHHYTLNEDLTLSHFIGTVVEKPSASK